MYGYRQENLYATYRTTDSTFWSSLARESQQEFQRSGTEANVSKQGLMIKSQDKAKGIRHLQDMVLPKLKQQLADTKGIFKCKALTEQIQQSEKENQPKQRKFCCEFFCCKQDKATTLFEFSLMFFSNHHNPMLIKVEFPIFLVRLKTC